MASPLQAPDLSAPATGPVGQRLRDQRRQLFGHALQTLAVCLAVGLLLGYLEGDYLGKIVYAVAIGGVSWALIDLGRFGLKSDPSNPWPTGRLGLVLCVAGCTAGFFIGLGLAAALLGHDILAIYRSGERSIAADMALSAAIGALLSGYFYLRGMEAYQQTLAERRERDLTLARLAVLQSQLEPHMLFNTLANLRVLIKLDAHRAQAMLDRLNAYLRATLSASRTPLHPLAAEFERLADYLALIGVRMGERLTVALELPEALRDAQVPPLILQPLVENAIRHGLEPRVEGGEVRVRARRDGEVLRLEVHDGGVGLSAAPATPAPGRTPAPGSGFGTRHVAERLQALYGDRAGFRLRPKPDGQAGALAEIWLPWQPGAGPR